MAKLTPGERLYPGRFASHVTASVQLTYVWFETYQYSSAPAALRKSCSARASKPFCRYKANCGIATAAKTPMIATTVSSSIRVNPRSFDAAVISNLDLISFRRNRPHTPTSPERKSLQSRDQMTTSTATAIQPADYEGRSCHQTGS